ncbi:hypothetical protein A3K63_03075 [Candidatus Micrarchaeota archaeon RBG_16_49_10]|nr:MAG: hypothetical protein A3K63_03075 [Candidatus Micrarchaeota archaeon RBG_16_49_10]
MPNPTLDSDFEWYTSADLGKYIGKWVAISNRRVIASNQKLKHLMENVEREHPGIRPLVTRVPEKVLKAI